jgi:hypothetical protein
LKPTYSNQPTPEQKAWIAKNKAENDETKRIVCNLFRFWCVCLEKRCRRAQSCVGDPQACFERCWPGVPEDAKVWFRAAVVAQHGGLSMQDAARVADDELVRWRELQVGFKQREVEVKHAAVERARRPH